MASPAVRSPLRAPVGDVETSAPVLLGTSKLSLRRKTNSIGMIKMPSKSNMKVCKAMTVGRSKNCNAEEDEQDNDKLSNILKKGKDWFHFVGVGGCGLSALALLALKQGFEVSGSDIAWTSYMDPLQAAGGRLFVGHSELNLRNPGGLSFPNAVVMSSAVRPDNVEILFAKSAGVPVYKRGAWLRTLTEDYNLVAVSGSHGKSTTTSMITNILRATGDDLSAIIGAQVPQADEYDGCFLELSPHIAVVTNVVWEHVDMFPDEEAVISIFKRFTGKIRRNGHLILCADRDYCFLQCHRGHPVADIRLQVPGVHNVLNSLAVIATASAVIGERQLSESIGFIQLHLNNFKGVSRQFEMTSQFYGCQIYDDYANNPYQVSAFISSSTADVSTQGNFGDFSASRIQIYGGRETNLWDISARDLAVSIKGPSSEFIPSLMDVKNKLLAQITEDPYRENVIQTLGGGDVTTVGRNYSVNCTNCYSFMISNSEDSLFQFKKFNVTIGFATV